MRPPWRGCEAELDDVGNGSRIGQREGIAYEISGLRQCAVLAELSAKPEVRKAYLGL